MAKKDLKGFLLRLSDDGKQTLGRLQIFDGLRFVFACVTLELPWRENQRNTSCFPPGEYAVEVRWSQQHSRHFILRDVKGREYILIHVGNYVHDTEGCILVGSTFHDLNKDGLPDVTSSKRTMQELLRVMPDKWTLHVVSGV